MLASWCQWCRTYGWSLRITMTISCCFRGRVSVRLIHSRSRPASATLVAVVSASILTIGILSVISKAKLTREREYAQAMRAQAENSHNRSEMQLADKWLGEDQSARGLAYLASV